MTATEPPALDLRFPVGPAMVWTATEWGFYAALKPYNDPPRAIIVGLRTYGVWRVTELPFLRQHPLGGVYGDNVLLGPYDTPEEARAALKGYAFIVANEYPFAVFEEPDGTTTPLMEWAYGAMLV